MRISHKKTVWMIAIGTFSLLPISGCALSQDQQEAQVALETIAAERTASASVAIQEVTSTPIPPADTITPMPSPTPTPIPAVCVLEDFEEGRQNSWFSPDEGVFNYWDESDIVHDGDGAFRISYQKSDTYQFIAFEQQVGCDFSQASQLQVWVYGQVELQLKLEDQDLNGKDVSIKKATDPNGWTQLTFKYTNVANEVDLANIKSVMFFPAPGDKEASGEFILDDIALFE